MSRILQPSSSATARPPVSPAPSPADWLVGGGELGELIRAKDWALTPLGAIDQWPQSLRSAVSISSTVSLFCGRSARIRSCATFPS